MAAADVVQVDIAQMIDLAIGHPEVGHVDFAMLQAVLHVLAQQARVRGKRVQLRGAAPPTPQRRALTVAVAEFLLDDDQEQQVPVEMTPPEETKPVTMLVVERVMKGDGWTEQRGAEAVAAGGGGGAAEPERRLSVVTLGEFQKLERSVEKLETRLNGPSNGDLLDDARSRHGSKSITDMWTSMNWSSRVETLEAGLQKLSSLVQELAGEYVSVQDKLNSSGSSTRRTARSCIESKEPSRGGEEGGTAAAAEGSGGGSGSVALEVKRLRADLDRLGAALRQLTGVDVADAGAGGRRGAGGAGVADAGGSLKKLRERVESIEKKMRKCCDRINKVDGAVGEQLTSLQDQVVGLGDDLATVNENLSMISLPPDIMKDVHGLSELFALVQSLQGELREHREATAALVADQEERSHNINVLVEQVELLKTIKMDREDMAEAMAEKADARLLTRKVSHDQFEVVCEDLTRGLDAAISKLTTQETLWQMALDDIQREIESKLDKMEMAPVKQFFCDKLRQLQESLRQMASLRNEADAAGTKKKFLRDVNCISCDARAIMAMNESAMIPISRPMPAHQLSMKPYLTYELDQIRKQQVAGVTQRNMHDWENIDKQSKTVMKARSDTGKHLCSRYCGGSHTVTTAAQRVTRLGHFLKDWGPDVMQLPPSKDDGKMLKPAKYESDNRGASQKDLRKGARPYGECRCIEEERV